MGVTAWCFLRSGPNNLRPVAGSAIEAFISGDGRLPPDADAFVRYAQVIVRLEQRRAIEVLSTGFFQYRTVKDGRVDRKHLREVMGAAAESAFGPLLRLSPQPAGVVPAEHKFAKRRLENLSRWAPTPDEHAQLRLLVNAKAGKALM